MAPKLIDIHLPFGITLPVFSYGLMILVGFLSAFLIVSRLGRKYGVTSSRVADIGIVAIISGFLGAKISFFLTNPGLFKVFLRDFSEKPIESLGFLSGGFDFMGGLILAVPTVFLFLRLWKLIPFSVGDLVAPGLAIAHAFGRIGCFMNGCCYGFRTESGVCFAKDSAVYSDQVWAGLIDHNACQALPVFPTQLLESGLLFVLCILLIIQFRRRKFAGQTFALYIAAYGVIRFLTQFSRDDEAIVFGPITIWHVVALVVMICGIVLYSILRKRNGNPLIFLKTEKEPVDDASGGSN